MLLTSAFLAGCPTIRHWSRSGHFGSVYRLLQRNVDALPRRLYRSRRHERAIPETSEAAERHARAGPPEQNAQQRRDLDRISRSVSAPNGDGVAAQGALSLGRGLWCRRPARSGFRLPSAVLAGGDGILRSA